MRSMAEREILQPGDARPATVPGGSPAGWA